MEKMTAKKREEKEKMAGQHSLLKQNQNNSTKKPFSMPEKQER